MRLLFTLMLFASSLYAGVADMSVWEYRTTGSNAQGGFYVSSYSSVGTTDYSQQDSSQVAFTDLAIDGADNTLIIATATPFVWAHVGNSINITAGTGFTVARYYITSTVTVGSEIWARVNSPIGTVGSQNGSGNLGGALALPTDALLELLTPGNTVYIKAGTYTLSGAISVAAVGTALKMINIEGYNVTRCDTPLTTNRPLITCGASSFLFGNYVLHRNLSMTGTAAIVFTSYQAFNCHSENTSGTANRIAHSISASGLAIGCSAVSYSGYGFSLGSNSKMYGCYAYNSVRGISCLGSSGGTDISFCVISSCTVGIYHSATYDNHTIYNNTFDGHTLVVSTGIQLHDCENVYIFNNIFSSWTTAIAATQDSSVNMIKYNDFYGNNANTSVIGIDKGNYFLDPGYTSQADLSVGTNMKAIGFPGVISTAGFTGYLDIGAVQRVEPAAGGGGGTTVLNNSRIFIW